MDSLITECMKLDIDNFLPKKNSKVLTTKETTINLNVNSNDSNTKQKLKKFRKRKQTKSKTALKEPKIGQRLKQSINPSKRHRDRLNSELDNLAKLLPFPEDVIARLDKLSILRLSVSYLRNKNYFKEAVQNDKICDKLLKSVKSENKKEKFGNLFKQALDGFVLVVTLNGEVFYVSDRVKEYLGYSQSQILHQPFETLVHDDDREEVASVLKGSTPDHKIVELNENGEPSDSFQASLNQPADFVVRLKSVLNTNSSDMYKSFRITGTIRRLNIEPDIENLRYALFGFCTPARTNCSVLEIRMKTTLFCSKNRIDLSFLDMDARGKEFFGYSKKDIFGRSSYVLAHRQDVHHLRCKQTEIMICGRTSVGTFRLMNKNNEWTWVCGYGRVIYKNGKPDIMVTTNRIMSDEEGQAMLRLRDEADYKSLTKIGLVEPDDPARALELGFPNRTTKTIKKALGLVADDDNEEPIPMPLPLAVPSEVPPLYDNPPIDSPPSVEELEKSVASAENFFDENNFGGLVLPQSNLDANTNGRGTSPTGSHISARTSGSRSSIQSTSSHEIMGVNGVHTNTLKHEEAVHDQPMSTSPHASVPAYIPPQVSNTIGNTEAFSGMSGSSTSSRSPPNINIQSSYFNEPNSLTSKMHLENITSNGHRRPEISSFMQTLSNSSFMQNPPNDFFRAHPTTGEIEKQDSFNRHLSQASNLHNDMFQNTNNRIQFSLYEQTGPNVTVNAPEYPDLSAALNMQIEQNSRQRMMLSQNRTANFFPNIFDNSWSKPQSVNNMNTQRTMLGNASNQTLATSLASFQGSEPFPWM